MDIEFYTKNVYGLDKMYVKDETVASKLRYLLGTITIDQQQMDRLTDLFDVSWKEVIAPKKV